MIPLSHPYLSAGGSVAAARHRVIRSVLVAAATLGQEEQPEIYRHVHPHGHATATLTRSFARAVLFPANPDDPRLDEIQLGAHLHDFGKYLVAKSVLLKPGPLTHEERAAISGHPLYGAQVLAKLPSVTDTVLQIVLYHHERWDGSGYPEGLKGENIPLAARIVSVVDVYTSLRARRTYKPSLDRLEAAATVEEMAGRELDPSLVEDFVRLLHGRAWR